MGLVNVMATGLFKLMLHPEGGGRIWICLRRINVLNELDGNLPFL